MVKYLCHRCGYTIKHKANFQTHLYRKNTCEPVLEDISIEIIKKMYGFQEDLSQMNPNESKMNPNESKNIYNCIYCNKCYTTNSNMRKHEKHMPNRF